MVSKQPGRTGMGKVELRKGKLRKHNGGKVLTILPNGTHVIETISTADKAGFLEEYSVL